MIWRVSRLHEMGFGIGLWDVRQHDIAALEKTSARFSIMNGFARGHLVDAEGAKALLDSARDTVELGKRLGVERLNITGSALGDKGHPLAPVDHPTAPMWLTAQDTLLRLVELAEAENVTFALENLNLLVDHPGTPFGRARETLALVSKINHPRLVMNLDLYHAQIGEGNLIALCQDSLPWIGEIQVADVPGRMEPGTGEVNWPNVARALAAMGYAGPVTLEAYARNDVETALAAFQQAFSV